MQLSANGSESRSRGKAPVLALLFVVLIALIALIVFQLRSRGKLGGAGLPSEGAVPTHYEELKKRLDAALKNVEKKTTPSEPLKVSETLATRPQPPPEQPPETPATTAAEPPSVPQQPAELTLKGVVWNARMPLALINDAVLGKDETIEGFKVVSIEKEGVVLEDGQGNRRNLALYKE